MTASKKLKLFNDPIYGFIGIPNALVFDLVAEPWFQRLRRISQMGMSFLVFPGAHHTRFHHALGAMHLMDEAIKVLEYKGVDITPAEKEALLCAILLHDIGHGPFSHALENSIVNHLSHEEISLRFMKELNEKYGGQLDTAIQIFTGEYPKKFLNQLVSSQLDMDRMDYLKRDSFYTGVAEGNINSERLLTMLSVVDGQLVVEEKGIYSVEKFLLARRFMYWQVYLHKTSLVAELLLGKIIQRAKELIANGTDLPCSPALAFFIKGDGLKEFDRHALHVFSQLDDIDLLAALKLWKDQGDKVLARLCHMLLDRDLPYLKIKKRPVDAQKLAVKQQKVAKEMGITEEEASYFVFHGQVKNKAYDREKQTINILRKNGKLTDVAKASDHLNINTLSETVTKYYACYPKDAV